MPSTSSQTVKLKSTLRLLIPRLRMAQKKDTTLSIAARREMATLLAQNREASARIRVENIIQTDITVEVMEMLELYAELLLARAGLLDGVKDGGAGDTGLEEASAAIIYAAPRLPREVKELSAVRAMLVERWGKEFGGRAAENRPPVGSGEGDAQQTGGLVPEKIVRKLKVETPSRQLVELYLEEIAKAYGVDWPKQREGEDDEVDNLNQEIDHEDQDTPDNDENNGGGGGGGQKEPPIPSTPKSKPNPENLGRAYNPEDLNRATPPREVGTARSPISVAPPGARTDNLRPKVRIPGDGDNNDSNAAKKQNQSQERKAAPGKGGVGSKNAGGRGGGGGGGAVGGKIPDVDELARRFQELKR
ncbi:MAG: hypothetical protein Q9227_005604 [Pyrenula ochraceoflavens]